MQIIDVLSAPWGIIPDKLFEIQEIYNTHLKGDKIDISQFKAKDDKKSEADDQRYQVVNGIAIIPIHGVIAKRMNLFSQISGGVSTQLVGQDIAEAIADDDISGILLDIDSPGGTVDGTQELANIIFEGRDKKPIIAYSDGMAASAAYWIGSAAHEFYISGDTVHIGSIGVVASHQDYSEYEKKQGIKTTEIYAGKYKRISSQYEPLTKDGKQDIQDQVDYIYSVFVGQVAKHKNVSNEQVVKNMADGRIFIGKQAITAGLVDGVSTINQAIDRLSMLSSDDIENNIMLKGEAIMNIKDFESKHPEMYKEVEEKAYAKGESSGMAKGKIDGAKNECERIKSVESQSLAGHEKLINELKFDGKTTGEQAAVKILQAEKNMRVSAANQLNVDAEPPVPASPPEPTMAQTKDFEALLSEYQATNKCSRGRALSAVAISHEKEHSIWLEKINGGKQ